MKYEEAIQYTRKVSKMMKSIILNSSSQEKKKNVGKRYHACIIACEAIEKQIPKKPGGDLNSVPHYRCAACGNGVKTYEDSTVYPYCHYCGQKLDWGDSE